MGQHELIERRLAGGDAGAEILIPHQRLEGKVAFQRGAGRTNAQHPAAAQNCRHSFGGGRRVQRLKDAVVCLGTGLTKAVRAVDEVAAKTAPVAEEVAVDIGVVAVVNPLQRPVALARQRVAADGAAGADRGRRLQIPLAGVGSGERLVGEDAGRGTPRPGCRRTRFPARRPIRDQRTCANGSRRPANRVRPRSPGSSGTQR